MKKIIAIAAASLLALNASADQSKTYIGGEFGISKVDDATGSATGGLVNAVGGAATATQDSTVSTFKILGGYRHSENVDFELGYFQSSTINLNFNGVARNSVAYTGTETMKFSGIEYATNLHPSVASGWNDLYFRIGGHSSKVETSVSVTANRVSAGSGKSYSGSGTLYGIGYDQKIDATLKVRYAAVKYAKVGGESDAGGTVYSIGLVKDF
jgi:hypothetical protein